MQTDQNQNKQFGTLLHSTADGLQYVFLDELETMLSEADRKNLQAFVEPLSGFYTNDRKALIKNDFDRFIQTYNIKI